MKKKNKILLLKCMCGCKTELMIQGDGETINVDIREPHDKVWRGIVIYEDIPKIKDFIKTL